MTEPIAIEIRAGAGYIRYVEAEIVETADITDDCCVAADLDAGGNVVGIEILDIANAEQLAAAQRYAAGRSLAFPRDLSGALASA